MSRDVCVVTGVGPGTGKALAERFAEGYEVAMLARNEQRLDEITASVEHTHAYPCDVTDLHVLTATLDQIRIDLGTPSILLHNAVGGAFGDFLSIDSAVLERNFQVNTMALLHLGQALAPAMIEQGHGAIICTGNTSAYRGLENFAAFAPSKAAQRILLESMARHVGPKGVHVAYIGIDAVIDLEWTRKRFGDKPDDFFIQPTDIAGECWHIAHQPRSAWTFNVLIRPFGEQWSIA
ncbi:MAG: SDR family NAD(P)-dependent oxidoreductase [Pseudomonadales bacterium]|jgi:NAD(P)-dependent dehydrogenase (short-subunit alcohol dehydrogenase family)|nr:SDR family NAD(P)-dependent oxidoreductase [Pseudomonadales bacterium]MDP6470416.1 SDR family NAD(P)-dependent oxidoreductase [Pseudomonadales bacterium]MDP6827716.1 SDR family NAD(P)-dependent oxidoreductase [Pseudomonadales bacterium]MDP6973361.1 SDR family NAD(P)-dependent oxidoreductase [Pseudomonadales bacterium]|tara:strand:- start:668 stop:1375 length:708 start_codon:yes stop_codon:yes gene_type:complete